MPNDYIEDPGFVANPDQYQPPEPRDTSPFGWQGQSPVVADLGYAPNPLKPSKTAFDRLLDSVKTRGRRYDDESQLMADANQHLIDAQKDRGLDIDSDEARTARMQKLKELVSDPVYQKMFLAQPGKYKIQEMSNGKKLIIDENTGHVKPIDNPYASMANQPVTQNPQAQGQQAVTQTKKTVEDLADEARDRYMNGDDEYRASRLGKADFEMMKQGEIARRASGRKDVAERGLENKILGQEDALRKEMMANPYIRDFITVDEQYQRVLEIKEENKTNPNKIAVDQALITVLNKMLDPNSVVRPEEYNRTSRDMALMNAIIGKMDKITSGGAGLTEVERNAMFDMIGRYYDVSYRMANKAQEKYKNIAETRKYNVESVVGKKEDGKEMSQDDQARAWLKANPNHPKAEAVRKKLGVK